VTYIDFIISRCREKKASLLANSFITRDFALELLLFVFIANTYRARNAHVSACSPHTRVRGGYASRGTPMTCSSAVVKDITAKLLDLFIASSSWNLSLSPLSITLLCPTLLSLFLSLSSFSLFFLLFSKRKSIIYTSLYSVKWSFGRNIVMQRKIEAWCGRRRMSELRKGRERQRERKSWILRW